MTSSIFMRPRRSAQQTLQQGNLMRDITTMSELQAAITAQIALVGDTGSSVGGIVARIVKPIFPTSTIIIPADAAGFTMIGSPWAAILSSASMTNLISVQCESAAFLNVWARAGSASTAFHTFIAGSGSASNITIDGCEAAPSTVFFTMGAATTGNCRVYGCNFNHGTLNTSSTAGGNVIMGNVRTGTLTTHATDAVGLNT